MLGSLPQLPRYLIAHRGCPSRAPENSAPAFVAAREARALVVELDVRPTSDGRLVVVHDPSAEATTGQKGNVWEHTLDELKSRPYLIDPKTTLISLDEALALLADRSTVNIEIKPGGVEPQHMSELLFDALSRCGSPTGIVVTCEDLDYVADVKVHGPLITTGLVFRSRDDASKLDKMPEAAANLLVANHRRLDDALLARAKELDLVVWAYTVNGEDRAKELFSRGVTGVVTDEFHAMQSALFPESSASVRRGQQPSVLVIDLGSSATKLSVIEDGTITARRSAPTAAKSQGLAVEHDAPAVADQVCELIDAMRDEAQPSCCAISSQRSTGLWCRTGDLEPLTPAASWRDRRGEALIDENRQKMDALESITGLAAKPAWTAISGSILRKQHNVQDDALLMPLGSWLLSRLTGCPPRVDSTLANRMFLLDGETLEWSSELLEFFELTTSQLPELVTSVGVHGELPWGDSTIPVTTLIGDQQAAFVGAAGPLGEKVVLNLGTAAFAMKSTEKLKPASPDTRCAPLWTSRTRPRPIRYLLERPLIDRAPWVQDVHSSLELGDRLACVLAEQVATGAESLATYMQDLATMTAQMIGPRDRSIIVSGGAAHSPHLIETLENRLPLKPVVATGDLTSIGAARLAVVGLKDASGLHSI